jgi:thymidylate kinase
VRGNRVTLISFSGIDGAGKSTQIEALCRHLTDSGLRYSLLTFWDDVVVLPRLREHMSLRAFNGEKGVGTPEKPINRRDKNVTSWYLTAFRMILYALDALHLRSVASRTTESGADFVIFDRYIYDEFANLPFQRSLVRLYVRMLLRIIPKPQVAFLVDADAEAATIRKPEYPLEFARRNREAYLQLSRIAGGMLIIPPLPIEEATEAMKKAVLEESQTIEGRLGFHLEGAVASEPAKTSQH